LSVLTPHDVDLIRRDRALPGLAVLLDTDAFLAAFRQCQLACELEDAEITYLRYKPWTSCLVGYQLQVKGGAVDIWAKAYQTNAVGKFLKFASKPSIPGLLGQGRFLMDEPKIGVSCFPNDDRLIALGSIADPHPRQDLLARIVPGSPEMVSGRLQRLRYKPLRRYVARVYSGENTGIVLRAYNNADYPAAQVNTKAFQSRGLLRLARRLGSSTRHQLLALEWLPGSFWRMCWPRQTWMLRK
jgi:hypothetical protein